MATVDCNGRSTRDINIEIKRLITEGETDIVVQNPGARHNLGVAVLEPIHLTFEGSVGYYCAGMIDGPTVEVRGSAGWGLAESMMNGTVIVRGSAGNGAAASIRGGTVVVHGDAAARPGVSMKGGTIVIAGNCGYMAGFMAQRGVLIVCGDTGEAFADSMYEAVCFVGGNIAELGNDAMVAEPNDEDMGLLRDMFSHYELGPQPPSFGAFKKVIAGRKLWNFDAREWETWRQAL